MTVAALLGVSLAGMPAQANDSEEPPHAGRTLRDGSPQQAGLVAEHVARIMPSVRAGLTPAPGRQRPLYPGAVALIGHRGLIVEHDAAGHAVRYGSSQGAELPPEQQIPMRKDTIFDFASISKLFTAVVAMQQVEAGRIDLDAPVAGYIPEFAQNGKSGVTLRHVLTHTAGLPPGLNLNPYPTIEERLAAVYAVSLREKPGARYIYSDLSMIVVGKVLERVAGAPLDQLVRDGVSEPLGLRDTMHNPPTSLRHRIAATEWQEGGRGLVWGEVHDRTSWLLGGAAGHAGLFGTAYDLAVFAQTLLNGGRHGDVRILRPESVRAMLTNWNAALGRGTERGLGFDIYKHSFMGAMATPHTAGHTGYTGTSLVLDPVAGSFAILMTNRVHPHRSWSDPGPARRAAAGHLARATPVRPAEGRDAWFSGMSNGQVAKLTLALPRHDGPSTLEFAYWWDTEAGYDTATLEASADGGATWDRLPMTLRAGDVVRDSDGTVSGYQGRQWHHATAALPAGTTNLRWRYVTDTRYLGRGVYLDAVRVSTPDRVVFEDSRPADQLRWRADGFVLSGD
ncbi:MAG: serine hydrolase [Micromonosporaceae bacterium]|nr:serine hydrolase [Micromonosporaceae bacterium]